MNFGKIVFISYAREDIEDAKAIYRFLEYSGFRPWMDQMDLVGGQKWDHAIERAVRKCDFFLFLASPRSVSKRGPVQREIRQALRMWSDRLEDDIFLIPLRLEACDVPESLAQFQWIDYFQPDGHWQLDRALRVGIQRLTGAADLPPLQTESRAINESIEDQFFVEIVYPRFTPSEEPGIAYVNATIEGFASKCAVRFKNHCARNRPKDVKDDYPNLPWGLTIRVDPDFIGLGVVSLVSREDVFTGGAHPNHRFKTFVFTRRPPSLLEVTDLFSDEHLGIGRISEEAIQELRRQMESDYPDVKAESDDWINKGAGPDPSNFRNFSITAEELRLYFDPYQVGCYAWGERYVNIPLKRIEDVLRPEIKQSLSIDRTTRGGAS